MTRLFQTVGQVYGREGYPIPSEDEYYQQDPDFRARSPSISSQKKSKPMPKESSFFIFSSKNK